jgi:hypothetical protein
VAGFQITTKSNVEQWQKGLDKLSKSQLPFALTVALNRTVADVAFRQRDIIARSFDQPTPFTKRAPQYRKAIKSDFPNLIAAVTLGDPILPKHGYLTPQVLGGGRERKRFEQLLINRGIMQPGEWAVPAQSLKLNKYGNMPQGLIQRILAQLGSFSDPLQNQTTRSKKSKTRKFFAADGSTGIARGIYERAGREIKCVLVFTSATPTYQKRYPFFETAREHGEEAFNRHFTEQMAKAIATARR